MQLSCVKLAGCRVSNQLYTQSISGPLARRLGRSDSYGCRACLNRLFTWVKNWAAVFKRSGDLGPWWIYNHPPKCNKIAKRGWQHKNQGNVSVSFSRSKRRSTPARVSFLAIWRMWISASDVVPQFLPIKNRSISVSPKSDCPVFL